MSQATQKPISEHDLASLEALYVEADQVDKAIFAEMRSNLLLVAGEHYQKVNASFFQRVRDAQDIPEQTKIRLTKNHIQKITKIYTSNILSAAPGVTVMPKNETELQDQKQAEMNESVWADGKERHNLGDLIDEWGDDYTGIGEIGTKLFWDKTAGKVKAYEQKMSETGQPLFLDAQGNEVSEPVSPDGQPNKPAPGNPQYTGEFVFEPIYGFNLLRSPYAKTMKSSPYLILRKMADLGDLTVQFPDVADKIKESVDETVMVFDAQRASYGRATNKQAMVKEIYFRPCKQYPKGFFYIWVREAILAKGGLPGGLFPIVHQIFERIQTSPRGRSPIKTMRPYQVEINRAASKMAEHQVTLGDDKLLIQNGTKISAGVALPGVRSINYTGMEPGILAGRDGSQYLQYMQAQIAEMYQVMDVEELAAEQKDGNIDPFALLFKSASQKKKFNRYVKRFESFLKELCTLYLELAKIHLPDDALIYATGRKELVNIAEFRKSVPLCYEVRVEAQSEDVESKLGKQMMLNHALQYVGNKLDKEDIGKIMRAMPYANAEESFSDLTLDYDSGTNMILALDRGEPPVLTEYDNYVYLIKRLVSRMRQADFKFLDPDIQQTYEGVVNQMQGLEAERVQKLQMAEQGFIPTGGYLVPCDVYVSDPTNPLKTRRARIPYQAVEWLIKKLETQGSSLDQLEKMNEGAQVGIAEKLPQQPQAGAPNGMGPSPAQGQETPGGVSDASSYGRTSSKPVF